ncbi:MAG: hypothetical protein LBD20_07630 [Spirochaetaceae bacterium]|jgi:metal-responsive CopG/Arc/MetJ family transcriptional regulator|nr:hypothetical protein [Spirochaetaceae bacterium]
MAKPAITKKRYTGAKKLLALTAEMEADISRFCAEKGIESESELIRQAIVKYLHPEDYNDTTLKLIGLKDLQKQVSEVRDMLNLIFIYLKKTHINLLVYMPEIDDTLKDAALSSAARRHDKFFDMFQKTIQNDSNFFERLLHTYFTGEGK